MKQVIQNLRSGALSVEEVPAPVLRSGGILVETRTSLVSAGTERMVMKLARKSLLGKAKDRPDLVRKVLQKMRRDGILATFQTVRDRLDREMPLGYSACGRVTAVGERADGFEPGELVACAGAGFANHAERIYVPRLLAARVPTGVSPEAAAYTTVGAIALQGIRNADVRVGETVVVIGLGLIGQLAVQILKAAGCRVAGLDPAQDRAALAVRLGADLAVATERQKTDSCPTSKWQIATAGKVLSDSAPEQAVLDFSRGRGADAVLITAATTSNAPVELAARLARDRARVVMVGVTGMEIPRKPYFEKELTFIVSRSYGPGRYDLQYEQHGHDYPAGYVRWTEQRNLEAFLDLVALGSVRPEECTTHRFPIGEAHRAFELVLKGEEPYLGVILTYPGLTETARAEKILVRNRTATTVDAPFVGQPHARTNGSVPPTGRLGISFVGAGNFARGVLLPELVRLPNVALRGVVSASGLSARSAARKFGFAFCTSREQDVFDDEHTGAVFIATPHSGHADAVCAALAAGKAVFVEKPLATSLGQLRKVKRAIEASPNSLMVGFNRRFSPMAAQLRAALATKGPMSIHYRCNAGPLPTEGWLADAEEGGRIVGEACHFVDFFAYLTGAMPIAVFAASPKPGTSDDVAMIITCEDGSVCQLTYSSAGSPGSGKERVEILAGGTSAMLEDFRHLYIDSGSTRRTRRARFRVQKGHAEEMIAFVEAVLQDAAMPITPESLLATTLVTLAARESVRTGRPVHLADMWDREDESNVRTD